MEKMEEQSKPATQTQGVPRRPPQPFQGGGRGRGVPFSSAPEGVGEKYKRKDFTLGDLEPHEVRIASKSKVSSCIQLAMEQLDTNADGGKVVLTACGHAIGVAVKICEILKRQVGGLHQVSDIGTVEITDEYEPLQDGLESVTRKRNVSFIRITLSKEPLDTADPGYQPPIESMPQEAFMERPRRNTNRQPRQGRGRGRPVGQNQQMNNATMSTTAMKATDTSSEAFQQDSGSMRGRRNNQRGKNPRRRGAGQGDFGRAEQAPVTEFDGGNVTTNSHPATVKGVRGTERAPAPAPVVTAGAA